MSRAIKGLLIKDFKLMKSQMKFFFIIMIVWGIVMAGSIGGSGASFLVGYTAVLCAFLTISTFSYDEFENGTAYLFTLPFHRKDYVSEKYLFGFLISTLPTIMIGMILWIVHSVQGKADHFGVYFLNVAVSLPMAYLLLALEIPLMVRFGQEKSRLVSVAMIGSMAAGFGIIRYLNELAGVDSMAAVSSIAGLDTGILVLIVAAVLAALLLVSYKISCRFMEKKQF